MTLYGLTQDVYQSNSYQADKLGLEDALADFFPLLQQLLRNEAYFLYLLAIQVTLWMLDSLVAPPPLFLPYFLKLAASKATRLRDWTLLPIVK